MLGIPANSPLRVAATLNHWSTKPLPSTQPSPANQAHLAPERVQCPCEPSGLRALARGSIGDQGTPLFEPSGEFGVTPQWCTSTKLPAQRAAVRLAGALRTLWRRVTHYERNA
jgi:hypothetical protein